MSITTKAKNAADVIYSFFRQTGSRTTLIGPDHSDASKDMLVVNQRDPVPQKNEQGYRRTEAEFQRTTVVAEPIGNVKKLARVSISSSLPVGMPDVEIEELFARACEVAKQGTQRKDFFVLGKRPA